jgi:DNA polymerase III epsilon subunit family exonuclease
MKILDRLHESLVKTSGTITVDEFHNQVLHMDDESEDSYNIIATILAMDGRFVFDGDVIKVREKKIIPGNLKITPVKTNNPLKRIVDGAKPNVQECPRDLLDSHILDSTYVVIDFETTGLSANINKVIEIGAVKIKNGKIVDRYKTLIDQNVQISSFITQLTGITNEMVKGSPEANDAFVALHHFIDGSTIVAHNLSFDHKFLNKAFSDFNLSMPPLGFCTMKLARRFLKNEGLQNAKLGTVATHFGLENKQAHRALEDAEVTAHIFNNFLDIAEKSGVSTVSALKSYEESPIKTV